MIERGEAVWQQQGFPSAKKLTGRTCVGGGLERQVVFMQTNQI